MLFCPIDIPLINYLQSIAGPCFLASNLQGVHVINLGACLWGCKGCPGVGHGVGFEEPTWVGRETMELGEEKRKSREIAVRKRSG
ncbi:hypothetical protein V6N13_104955 [Hibiscus sabdariffa]|uniref:Uncharacterized protein n=2 Tax=Hibiscus sabdariffa TaxID=183260 RepID=A0ABR2SJ90_9ROSI